MGIGSDFICCKNNNIFKSTRFDPENYNGKKKPEQNIETEKAPVKFSNNSRIANAQSFKESGMKLDEQQQQDDNFEEMFNKL